MRVCYWLGSLLCEFPVFKMLTIKLMEHDISIIGPTVSHVIPRIQAEALFKLKGLIS